MNNYIDPPNKLLKHTDRVADIMNETPVIPINVEIDLTNRCNLGCQGCHMAYLHSRGVHAKRRTHETGDIMDTELAISIVRQLAAVGVRSITWTGGGEPTLHPDIAEIIRYTLIPQGIYTNGVQVTPELASLLKIHMDWVYVSLDRHDRDRYMKYKAADKFNAACTGIRNLVKSPGGATIGVGFLLSRANWGDGWDMIHLAEDLGVDYVQFRPEVEYDPAHPDRAIHDNTWLKPCIQWLDGIKDRRGVQVDTSRFEMYRNWGGHPYRTCYWSQLQTVITPDGRVWVCCNRRGYKDSAWGDLKLESFADIVDRIRAWKVDNQCRVMCRGHIPNLTLNKIMEPRGGHDDFV